MLKKTIPYKDYNGVERVEDFYFNLSKAEAMEMELSISGGLTEMIRRIVAAQDTPTIIATFKEIILKAYGEKSGRQAVYQVRGAVQGFFGDRGILYPVHGAGYRC